MKQSTKRFSDQLEQWLKRPGPKTIGDITQTFGEKAYAVTILLLMIIPALPLPTGGITHVFEVFTIILSLPVVVGCRSFWMPGFIARRQLGNVTTGKLIPAIMKIVRRLERFSRPRGRLFMQALPIRVITAIVIIGLAVAAALAPPFSGLDTFPALGAVIITLGIILDDILFVIIGIVLGITGIGLVIFLGAQAVHLIHHLL